MKFIHLHQLINHIDAIVSICIQDLVYGCPSFDTLMVEMRDYCVFPVSEGLRMV